MGALAMTEKNYWSSSSGKIELEIELDDALCCGGQGRQDDNVAALRKEPYIKTQLDALDPAVVRSELQEYGAWDAEELARHEDNLAPAVMAGVL